MDDDVVRRISSFPLMNKIPKLVDKENLSEIFYCRDIFCAVTYIQKEYLCCQIRANMLDKSLSKCVPHDNQQDFELACNSLNDSDGSISEDGADKKNHLLELDPKNFTNFNCKTYDFQRLRPWNN